MAKWRKCRTKNGTSGKSPVPCYIFLESYKLKPDENRNIDSSQNPLHVGWSRKKTRGVSHVRSKPRCRGTICHFLAKSGSFGSGAQGCVPFANTSERKANQTTRPTHFEYPQLPSVKALASTSPTEHKVLAIKPWHGPRNEWFINWVENDFQ